MAKITVKKNTVEGTVDIQVTLVKEWTNPEGGALKKIGTTLIVTPELYEIMEKEQVI